MADTIELLAPAKNRDCGMAAIDHGADAVYIGGPLFGARAAAANSLADIEQVVRYAHLFRVRVYVTINTLLNEDELDQAVRLCHQLDAIGVDALIIQDPGLLESDLPPLPLHSSTQMNNRTPEKVRFLEQVGFTQVVLARELNLEQIKAIRAATTVPLECFVHGALCVAYSGQCFLSEVVAKRSANRGECAQFCRHSFTLLNGNGTILVKDRFLLSLKDLDLSPHLTALIDAGVRSFKIEGRLKDIRYVKNVTAAYRQALDGIIDSRADLVRASSGQCRFDFVPDPARSFNRGATASFLQGVRGKVAEIRTPKSIGKKIGRVTAVTGQSFVLEGDEPVHNGDGLCFFDCNDALIGIRVNRVEGNRIFPKDGLSRLHLPLGTEIHRNNDTAFNALLAHSTGCRTIAVRMRLSETGEGLLLRVEDEEGIVSTTTMATTGERSNNAGTIAALAVKQLKKSGGTVFSVEEVNVRIAVDRFIPAAVFNALRRQALDHHAALRVASHVRKQRQIQPTTVPWPQAKIDYRDNITNSRAAAFYRRHGAQLPASDRLRAGNIADCALMTSKYCIRFQLGLCTRLPHNRQTRTEPLFLADNTGRYALHFDCDACEMTLTRMPTDRQKQLDRPEVHPAAIHREHPGKKKP